MKKLIVLIPHYNNVEALERSLLSIQENIEVDVLVVDDGSVTPPDVTRLKSCYIQGKLFLEILPKNQGIEGALNHGLKLIQEKGYEYTARLDCGDLNKPNKYDKQVSYLEEYPDIKLLGTWVDMVSETGEFLFLLKHPVDHKNIIKQMYYNSCFVHPSVVFKTEILNTVGLYPLEYPAAEDYAFFFKIMNHFEVANYPESLLIYEINENSISSKKRKLQVESRLKIIKDHFKLGYHPLAGLLRNSILYFLPRSTTTYIKSRFGNVKAK